MSNKDFSSNEKFGENYYKGKNVVILGCSGEGGLGYVAAETLVARGANVIVASRSMDKLTVLAERLGGLAVQCDAGVEDDVKALARTASEHFGKVDVAINAAGMPVNGDIASITAVSLQRAMDVNYLGNVYFVREMAEVIGNDGAIILYSSMSSTHPFEGLVGYACAKAATDCLVRYAAIEYGARNIRINSILPGAIWSHMSASFFSSPGVNETISHEIPLGRLGTPEEGAQAVLWLSGPSYVTGLSIPIAGGQQLTRYPFASEYPSVSSDALQSSATTQVEKFDGLA